MESEPAQEYTLYKYAFKGLESEFFHFDFIVALQLFSKVFLQEPTCQDLIKSFRAVEKAVIFNRTKPRKANECPEDIE